MKIKRRTGGDPVRRRQYGRFFLGMTCLETAYYVSPGECKKIASKCMEL